MITFAILLLATLEEETKIERWDRAVCLVSIDNKNKSKQVGTGYIVDYQEKFFLVTAKHVGLETNSETRVLFRNGMGKSEWVKLAAFVPKKQDPWVQHKKSDLALVPLARTSENGTLFDRITRLSIPCEQISLESQRRTAEIEVAGFPLGLGLQGEVSPIVVPGNIASQVINTKNKWGSEPIVYSWPALGQGTSGGPAFLSAKNTRDVQLVGMFVGVVLDKSGAKLSKLVPSKTIRQFVESTGAIEREQEQNDKQPDN